KTHPGALSSAFAAALNRVSGLIERGVSDRRFIRFAVGGKGDFLGEISVPGRRPATTFRDVFESSWSLCNVKRVLGLELTGPTFFLHSVRGRNRRRPIVIGSLCHRVSGVERIHEFEVLHLHKRAIAEADLRTPSANETVTFRRFTSQRGVCVA